MKRVIQVLTNALNEGLINKEEIQQLICPQFHDLIDSNKLNDINDIAQKAGYDIDSDHLEDFELMYTILESKNKQN